MKLKDTPWKRSYDKPRQHIKKQRRHFANKGPDNQSSSSSHVWMRELGQKEDKSLRIDAFKLWCWRRRLRVPWTARKSNQSILKEINPAYSLEGPLLKLQYSGHLMRRADSLEKSLCRERLRAGGEGGHRVGDSWMVSSTQGTWVWANSRMWWRTGKPGVWQYMGSHRVRHDLKTEQQQLNVLPLSDWCPRVRQSISCMAVLTREVLLFSF